MRRKQNPPRPAAAAGSAPFGHVEVFIVLWANWESIRNSKLIWNYFIHEMEFVDHSVSASSSSSQQLRQQLETLVAQRDLLELEADAIHSELTSPGVNGEPPAGIRGDLIDTEGFPRADIDLFNVRNKRRRLAEINTDHSAIMKNIEKLMLQLQEILQEQGASTDHRVSAMCVVSKSSTTPHGNMNSPIAMLDEILPGSPAHSAGIQEGDFLICFGHINIDTKNSMQAIAKLVGESVGKSIHILVVRNGKVEEITLIPQSWGGRGLLGCHLSPIK